MYNGGGGEGRQFSGLFPKPSKYHEKRIVEFSNSSLHFPTLIISRRWSLGLSGQSENSIYPVRAGRYLSFNFFEGMASRTGPPQVPLGLPPPSSLSPSELNTRNYVVGAIVIFAALFFAYIAYIHRRSKQASSSSARIAKIADLDRLLTNFHGQIASLIPPLAWSQWPAYLLLLIWISGGIICRVAIARTKEV